ncbi:hypothetical protein CEP54_000334 [Fusarium duplospermum]|uniref:Mid2 domain-containing protein n=1 Tax=Fusarium duplospermum TaxID=1325734 RepID=A0A428R771_9HYPO|nr:hypothetical protein CEP54_000334 [Fusarium duplospermum]
MASFRFIFAVFLSSKLVHAQCYYPNGQDAPRDTPCQPDAEASACCAEGYICMSTGMCQFVQDTGTGKFARGSCTNQDWSSSLCPNYCTDADGEEKGGTDVTRCQGYTDRFFCPKSQNANVCKDESKALIFSSEPSVIKTILAASNTVQSTQSTETSEATTTTSSQETTSTAKDEETSTTASTSPNETGPADSDSDSDSDSGPSPAVLGGAIGGSIGGFLLGGLGVWLIFFLRRGKNQSRVVPEPENGYKDNHQPGPKAEMSAESPPAELPGYSLDERSRQE